MDYAIGNGTLEIRQDGRNRTIQGEFPYNSRATISDRGTVRKEQFSANAFAFALADTVEGRARQIDLLKGHNFNQELASTRNATLRLESDSAALVFEAELPPIDLQTVLQRDTVSLIDQGLLTGVSPGFRVPPASAVPGAVSLIPDPEQPGVMIRQINEAVLFEVSLIVRPAYKEATAELRTLVDGDLPGGRVVLHRLVL